MCGAAVVTGLDIYCNRLPAVNTQIVQNIVDVALRILSSLIFLVQIGDILQQANFVRRTRVVQYLCTCPICYSCRGCRRRIPVDKLNLQDEDHRTPERGTKTIVKHDMRVSELQQVQAVRPDKLAMLSNRANKQRGLCCYSKDCIVTNHVE